MSALNAITHEGIIEKIEDHNITVRFTVRSACAHCHAKRICPAAGQTDKQIEIQSSGECFSPGDKVNICIKPSGGYLAVFLGYVLPLLIVILSLVIASIRLRDELTAGLVSLFWLVPYYLALYGFRNRVRKRIDFFLKKL